MPHPPASAESNDRRRTRRHRRPAVLPGTLTTRTRCGTPLRLQRRPAPLHGPYRQWTRKIAGQDHRAIAHLRPARDYQAWIDNDRRLRELLAQLEALGAAAFEADPRWNR